MRSINWDVLSKDDAELYQSLQAVVESLGEEATADHPMVEVRDKLATAFRDKAALLKRNWTDEMFQEGEDMNEEKVAEIETAMASALGQSGGGLQNGQNLGNALDLVGVYMKNYKLDRADAVLSRCGPFVSDRGGVWMIKWLNHVSTVRMKQSRHLEALEMLYELELYSPYDADEAPEFFATLYRNLAWALKALGRLEEAAIYFNRMATASQKAKGNLDWFDKWDIGKISAAQAFRDGDMDEFFRGRALVEEALELQMQQEPDDLVMRAKVHDSLAECYMVVKEYPKANEHYSAAYDLLLQTVGKQSPLFGKQARHAANLQISQGNYAEALPFLGEALAVEASKDAVNITELMELKRGSPTCQRLALPSLATGLVGFAVCNPKRPSRRRQRRLSRCVLRATKAEASKLVICFDFDGVVCDSVDESSTAAWKHARDLWPLVSTLGDSPQPFLDPMRLVRPVIETGWENTLIIRMLADANLVEAQSQKGEAESASLLCKDILAGWEQLRDEKVRELKLDVQGLIKGFGEVRDKWMAEDLKSWFGTNRAYDRVPDVIIQMLSSGAEVFVITTSLGCQKLTFVAMKQKRFAEALLQDFGIKLPAGHVFALEDGPKTEVLKSLLARAEYREKNFHFIEETFGLSSEAPVVVAVGDGGAVAASEPREVVKEATGREVAALTFALKAASPVHVALSLLPEEAGARLVAFNMAIASCSRAHLLHVMPEQACTPDAASFTAAMSACKGSSQWRVALALMNHAEQSHECMREGAPLVTSFEVVGENASP
eukprot:g29908.t2